MHPLGELERSPRPVTTIGKRVILLREREKKGEEIKLLATSLKCAVTELQRHAHLPFIYSSKCQTLDRNMLSYSAMLIHITLVHYNIYYTNTARQQLHRLNC